MQSFCFKTFATLGVECGSWCCSRLGIMAAANISIIEAAKRGDKHVSALPAANQGHITYYTINFAWNLWVLQISFAINLKTLHDRAFVHLESKELITKLTTGS